MQINRVHWTTKLTGYQTGRETIDFVAKNL
jgi:hypothetical protein